MTDKEFKKLSRAQLIDIIYQLQLQIDELNEKNKELEEALEDKRIRMKDVGNIAEAALKINDCFQSAQNAAEQYLNEIKDMHKKAIMQRKRIIYQAKAEAASIISAAKMPKGDSDIAEKTDLEESKENPSDKG